MIFKICIKKLIRTPVKSLLFFFVLVMSGTLISLGASLLVTAKETGKKVDESITTIAVPNVIKIRTDSGGDDAWIVDGNMTRTVDNFYEINQADKELYHRVMGAGIQVGIGAKDQRKSYYAFSKELSPILIEGNIIYNPYNSAVFEAVCESIEEQVSEWSDSRPQLKIKMHQIQWSVLKAVALHSSYEVPETMLTSAYIHGLEMGVAIEPGKRYLIAGDISNAKKLDEKESITRSSVYFSFFPVYIHEGVLTEEGSFIPYIELKDGMNVDEFLNLKEGSDFKRLVNNCTSIVHSANVITTDNLNSVVQFNQRKAYIVKGREMTTEEYEQGQRVCIISSEFAEYNKVNIGDILTLSLANASYSKMMHRVTGSTWDLEANPFTIQYSQEESFEVVGIYQAPEWEPSEYALTPNAIFVPSQSISSMNISPEKQESILMQYDIAPILYSIIIPNDKLEAFKASIEQTGLGQYFLYYDQGYSFLKNVIETVSQNAIILFIVSVFVWISVLVLFLLLYVIREKQLVGIMLSLGTGAKRAFLYLFISCLLLAVPSAISSTIISNVLEENVTKVSYESAVEQSSFNDSFSDIGSSDQGYSPFNDVKGEYLDNIMHFNTNKITPLIGVLQLLLILCACCISIYILVKKTPMQLLNSKED